MTAMTEAYLIEVDGQHREREVLRRLCENPFLLDELLAAMGLPAGFYWVLLGVQHSDLVSSRHGDVDLIAGRMAIPDQNALMRLTQKYAGEIDPRVPACQHSYFAGLELAASGGLQWPPPLDYVVAIETKCAYFNSDTMSVMSQKSSPTKVHNMRTQISELLEELPFNRVALLDLIINPPATGQNGQAWLSAAGTAVGSLREMMPTLCDRLPSDSPAGHFVMSWGAVAGGTEAWRGTGAPLQLRVAKENPRLQDSTVHTRRRELDDNLCQILTRHSRPLRFPLVL
jgi:hypothetical protein